MTTRNLASETMYEADLKRLYQIIEKNQKVLLITGDIHCTQTFKTPCDSYLGFPLYEVTSSGMSHTQSIPDIATRYIDLIQINNYDYTPIHAVKNFGMLEFNSENITVSLYTDYGEPIYDISLTYDDLV